MSGVTGPLAQQFAQVREGLGDGCAFACGCEDPGNPQRCIHAERFAALSSIERHTQDIEKALRDEFFRIVPDLDYETEGLLGGVAWAWEVHPWYVLLGLTEAECIAALSAREKEEE